VDINQSEVDALVVRSYLSGEEWDNGAAIKKAIEAYSQTWCSSFSPKPLSALVELASDRSILGNASQSGRPLHGLRVTVASRGDGTRHRDALPQPRLFIDFHITWEGLAAIPGKNRDRG
jgi:hypothetical protein